MIGERTGKTWGRNKSKEITKLKRGEKLPLQFYNNRDIRVNQGAFANTWEL